MSNEQFRIGIQWSGTRASGVCDLAGRSREGDNASVSALPVLKGVLLLRRLLWYDFHV